MHSPRSLALQRLGPLAQLPGVLASYGVSLDAVLEGLSLSAADLRADNQLTISTISAMLDRAAAYPGLEHIGLLIVQAQNHTVLGPVGQLMLSCETLGSALGTFVMLQMANSTAGAAYLHPVGEDHALGFGIYAPDLPSSHIYDASAAIGHNMVRDLTGGAVRPAEVLLGRPAPRNPEPYRRFFGCPVRFNEGQNCLILPGRSLGFRLPSADAKLRERLISALQQQIAQQQQGFAPRVRHAIRPLLVAGDASHKRVAAHLNLHPRTMGRRLEEEGITFEQLKDEVRLAVARELLARTAMAVSDVAGSLGYATPSAFVRAFRRWTGTSPSAWRRQSEHTASG
ncbi:MAG: AraC family transcriptional regulator ligand-binding domain-containing protein [Aestuariivirga sp.]|uniref:AraC family transcriptional regulator n=1 Tax=Aestuariivirga sp. TaxID=2650926 RepID=UPI0025B80BA2|nr:AraC family transcriptional regulator [Aestuariivirga sp.]MCA3560117.1 AraC family transcriptional regulator ligand-binding domain-containing protein [Aestuariivirga sp.]